MHPPLRLLPDFTHAQQSPIETQYFRCTVNHHLDRIAELHRTSVDATLLTHFRTTLYRVTGECDGTIGFKSSLLEVKESYPVHLVVEENTTFKELLTGAKSAISLADGAHPREAAPQYIGMSPFSRSVVPHSLAHQN